MKKPSREEIIQRDVEDLRKLGYAQQLFREMGGFSNFAISFSIISILTGAVTLFAYGLKFAGPIINTVGWPVVSLFTLCIAASMAELASMYPTAGGLYFWAYKLGGRGWAWVTGWMNMLGQISITAGVNVAAATYLIGAVTTLFNLPDHVGLPLFGSVSTSAWYFQVAVMVVITIPQVLVNIYGIRLTARLNDFSVYWHIAGVFVIVGLLLFLGTHHNDPSFLLKGGAVANPLEASSDTIREGVTAPALVIGDFKFPSPLFGLLPGLKDLYQAAPLGLVFILGLLQAQWTYTGYDASAHVAEETVMARLNSAWGIFLSVAVSAVVGYMLLMVLTWRIPNGDVATAVKDTYPVLFIARENLGDTGGNVVAVIIGVAMWLCGLSCIGSMGRMWYAFARDDGMIGARWLKRVDPKHGTPITAILVTTVLSVVLCLYAAAYSVITGIGVITLYIAYTIPVFLNLRNRQSGKGECSARGTAPWSLGKWSPLINVIAVLWAIFICVVFAIPPNELVLWTMLLVAVLLGIYWVCGPRRYFTGPQGERMKDEG